MNGAAPNKSCPCLLYDSSFNRFIFRQSSEKYFANRRKNIEKFMESEFSVKDGNSFIRHPILYRPVYCDGSIGHRSE